VIREQARSPTPNSVERKHEASVKTTNARKAVDPFTNFSRLCKLERLKFLFLSLMLTIVTQTPSVCIANSILWNLGQSKKRTFGLFGSGSPYLLDYARLPTGVCIPVWIVMFVDSKATTSLAQGVLMPLLDSYIISIDDSVYEALLPDGSREFLSPNNNELANGNWKLFVNGRSIVLAASDGSTLTFTDGRLSQSTLADGTKLDIKRVSSGNVEVWADGKMVLSTKSRVAFKQAIITVNERSYDLKFDQRIPIRDPSLEGVILGVYDGFSELMYNNEIILSANVEIVDNEAHEQKFAISLSTGGGDKHTYSNIALNNETANDSTARFDDITYKYHESGPISGRVRTAVIDNGKFTETIKFSYDEKGRLSRLLGKSLSGKATNGGFTVSNSLTGTETCYRSENGFLTVVQTQKQTQNE
jgi:hypothetical protein